jgi:heptosyltransferase-1/heptosyltransferase-2
VLVSLKRRWPEAEIDWLVQTSFLDAVRCHPDLARAIPFPRRRLGKRRIWTREGRRALAGLLRALRGQGAGGRYDLVVDCQGLTRSGLFSWISGARRRVGFANAREFAWLGYTERHRIPTEMHTVDRMLALIEAAGVPAVRDMRLYAPPEERERLDERLRERRFAVVAPTSRWEGKRWPDDRFARVIEAMLADTDLDAVAVVASESERDQCRAVLELGARDRRIVDLVGQTSVGGLMAVVEASGFVLANDSAALHMAVGFDKPLVALFGPTRIDLVGPYAREADVIQGEPPPPGATHKDPEAGRAMMERIDAERVIEAVMARRRAHPSAPDPSRREAGVPWGEG